MTHESNYLSGSLLKPLSDLVAALGRLHEKITSPQGLFKQDSKPVSSGEKALHFTKDKKICPTSQSETTLKPAMTSLLSGAFIDQVWAPDSTRDTNGSNASPGAAPSSSWPWSPWSDDSGVYAPILGYEAQVNNRDETCSRMRMKNDKRARRAKRHLDDIMDAYTSNRARSDIYRPCHSHAVPTEFDLDVRGRVPQCPSGEIPAPLKETYNEADEDVDEVVDVGDAGAALSPVLATTLPPTTPGRRAVPARAVPARAVSTPSTTTPPKSRTIQTLPNNTPPTFRTIPDVTFADSLDILIYLASGVLLIFIMEQFVRLGMLLR